ncbi:unnamed protein product [Rhizoctonia solani]|uniref:Uncharacterized protein n=1 Tax=Rhizoctonia solani TaxID=456999 RepID=A0A8H2WAB4_9AGAM|nr:unnamed protein product [Rhizoctonia solani]
MAGRKRSADAGASDTRAAKATKVSSKDAATTKKPASKASEKPASKSKVTGKPASKAKVTEKPASKGKSASKSEKAAPKSTGKAKPKSPPSAEDFKAKALPLHANLTQTPPKFGESNDSAHTIADDGFIASIAMQPTTFNTGSYGWKGSGRMTVPLPGGTEEETVTAMININASVLGSKSAASEAEKGNLAGAMKEDLTSESGSD